MKQTKGSPRGGDIDTDIRKCDGPGFKTVIEYLEDCREEFRPYAELHEPLIEQNEQYFAGTPIDEDEDDVALLAGGEDLPVVHQNLITNIGYSWVSRIAKPRQRIKAWPSDPSISDEMAAKVANAYVDYQYQIQDIDNLVMELCTSAFVGGSAAFKVCWDPEGGQRVAVPIEDEFGLPVYNEDGTEATEEIRLGEVYWKKLTPFDYMIDPVNDYLDARWVIFKKLVSNSQAKAIIKEAGAYSEEDEVDGLEESKSTNVSGISRSGVEVQELWVRPEDGETEGFMATIVANKVVDMRPYPYEHGQLPISIFHVRKLRDDPYGRSPCFDIIDGQRQFDHYLTSAARVQKVLCDNTYLLASGGIIKAMEHGHQRIAVDMVDDIEKTMFLLGPIEQVKHFHELAQTVRKNMYETAGLNEVLTGAENAKASQSGKAISYMQELDSQKMIASSRNLDSCLVRAFRQTLRLAQQWVSQERMIAIVGAGGERAVERFAGASLQGIDVRLEPISGVNLTATGKSEHAQELMQAGMLDPARAQEMMRTGLDMSQSDALDRQVVQQQINLVLQGQMVQPEQGINVAVAVEELGFAIEQMQAEQNMNAAIMLNQLLLGYRLQSQQPQPGAQAPQQGMMPPPMPGGPQGMIPG